MRSIDLTDTLDYTMSEAGGVTDFVRQYTLASGAHCDCGYKKKSFVKVGRRQDDEGNLSLP